MFVKNFFLFFFLDPRLGFPLTLYTHCIIDSVVCQEVFQLFFSARLPSGKQPTWEATPRPSTGELVPLTDKGIIAHPVADCNRQNAQIAGFLFFVFCATFPLDKLLAAWYNRKFGRAHSRPGRRKSKTFLQSLAFTYEIFCFILVQNLFCLLTLLFGFAVDVEHRPLTNARNVIARNVCFL